MGDDTCERNVLVTPMARPPPQTRRPQHIPTPRAADVDARGGAFALLAPGPHRAVARACEVAVERPRATNRRQVLALRAVVRRNPSGFGVSNLPCCGPGTHDIPMRRQVAQTCAPWPQPSGKLGASWRATRGAPPLAVAGWKSLGIMGHLCIVSGTAGSLWAVSEGPRNLWKAFWHNLGVSGCHWNDLDIAGKVLGKRLEPLRQVLGRPWKSVQGLERPVEVLGRPRKVLGGPWQSLEGLQTS